MSNNSTKIYNILLPLWLLIFLPSYFWLVLIPLNYLIDRVVLKWSLGDMPDKGLFCSKAGLDPEQVKRSALRLALITAPYLYLFPSELLYQGGILD